MGSISGMVSQLTCCSLVSVIVRVSVSRLFFCLRRLRAFAHPPAGKAKQGAEQQKRQMRHSRHHRQYEHDPGGGVEHRRLASSWWRTSWAISPLSLTRVTIIAAAVESSREGICATVPSPMVISTYCWKAASALRLYLKIPIQTPPIRLIARIIIPAMASPRTNFDAPSIAP